MKPTDVIMQASVEANSANPDAPSRGPHFVRVPQFLLDFKDRPLVTLTDVILLAEDVGKQSNLVYAYAGDVAPKASWGSIVYKVAEDGRLTVHARNIDTSD